MTVIEVEFIESDKLVATIIENPFRDHDFHAYFGDSPRETGEDMDQEAPF